MLRKLLKYDLRAVFRVWWIAAAISLLMAVLGGACLYVRANKKFFPDEMYVLAGVMVFFVYFSLAALLVLTMVLIFVRLFGNFFTDEGYLTFTLPVSRLQLVNSKVITGFSAITVTELLIAVEIGLMLFIRDPEKIISPLFWNSLKRGWEEITQALGNYIWIYMLEALALALLYTAFCVLFLYVCISFASMIVKKGKLIAAIGIYYGANSLMVSIMQLFALFGLNSLGYWMDNLSTRQALNSTVFILLGLICFIAMFCGLLYGLQYYLVDKKLNLS